MNNVSLIGRLVKDPESKSINDKVKADVTIAVRRRTKADETDYIDLQVWDKTAQILCDHCTKGSQIGIEGSLRKDSWKDKDGNTKSRFYVIVTQLTLISQGDGNRPSKVNNDFD